MTLSADAHIVVVAVLGRMEAGLSIDATVDGARIPVIAVLIGGDHLTSAIHTGRGLAGLIRAAFELFNTLIPRHTGAFVAALFIVIELTGTVVVTLFAPDGEVIGVAVLDVRDIVSVGIRAALVSELGELGDDGVRAEGLRGFIGIDDLLIIFLVVLVG